MRQLDADVNSKLLGRVIEMPGLRANGEEFTLTATKTVADVFPRPVIFTAGLRVSEAANLGFLG